MWRCHFLGSRIFFPPGAGSQILCCCLLCIQAGRPRTSRQQDGVFPRSSSRELRRATFPGIRGGSALTLPGVERRGWCPGRQPTRFCVAVCLCSGPTPGGRRAGRDPRGGGASPADSAWCAFHGRGHRRRRPGLFRYPAARPHRRTRSPGHRTPLPRSALWPPAHPAALWAKPAACSLFLVNRLLQRRLAKLRIKQRRGGGGGAGKEHIRCTRPGPAESVKGRNHV